MRVATNDLNDPQVQQLLREHLAGMRASSPPGSCHVLDLAGLKSPDITFWAAWDGDDLMGCGALKQLAADHGEIKSMRTSYRHLRKGVAREILNTILTEARRRGYARVSLETGSSETFQPALAFYESVGFSRCGPFADYREDPFSVFMTKAL